MLATQHLSGPSAPKVGLVLATHNAQSVEMMRKLRQEQLKEQLPLAEVVYSQLMGMADELSLNLIQKREVNCPPSAPRALSGLPLIKKNKNKKDKLAN